MAENTPSRITIGAKYQLIDGLNAFSGNVGDTASSPMQSCVLLSVKVRGQEKEALIAMDAVDCDALIRRLQELRETVFGGKPRPKDPRRPWRK